MSDYIAITLDTGYILQSADQKPSGVPEEQLCDLPDTVIFGVNDLRRLHPKIKGFTLHRKNVVTWTNLQI